MNRERTDELIALLLEGKIDAGQLEELKRLMADAPAVLAEVRSQLVLHGQIGVAMEDDLTAERRSRKIMESVADADGAVFAGKVTSRIRRRKVLRNITAMAAVVVLSLVALFFWSGTNNEESIGGELVATLVHADGVQWSGERFDDGTKILVGDVVSIRSGLLEMELDGRGTLIIEGPAQVGFRAADHAVLELGRVVMRATEKGHGYRVETPQGSVIDLGTEFGVSVSENKVVETHVIDGSVEAVPTKGKPVTLAKNDALRLGSGGGEAIDADLGRFYTRMPPRHGESGKFVYWGFDEAKGQLARATGELGAGMPRSSDLVFHAMDRGMAPEWTSGVHGSALQFDGRGGYAESGYRGIGGGAPRTVSFWLRVPEDFDWRQGFGIVSWGHLDQPGGAWQISINPLLEDGPMGRLRLGLHGGQIIGSTDLRDGEWHHVAVVMYGGSQPNVGTHVLLYVDGEMETVSRAALQEVKTEVDKAKHGLWVGRNVSYHGGNISTHVQGGFFRGALDELYVFDVALSQKEVLELMEGM